MRRLLIPTVLAATLAIAGPAGAAEPKLTVSKAKLRAALKCTPGVKDATRTPVMLVTGTGASGDEAYLIGKPAFDAYGAPVCWVNFPNHTTADVLVDGRAHDRELARAEPVLQHVGVQERAVDVRARAGDGAGHLDRELGHEASFFFSANRVSRASSRWFQNRS